MKKYITIFVFSGYLFAIISITLSLLPINRVSKNDSYVAFKGAQEFINKHNHKDTTVTSYFENTKLETIAMAIISATCFIVAGSLIKSNKH